LSPRDGKERRKKERDAVSSRGWGEHIGKEIILQNALEGEERGINTSKSVQPPKRYNRS